MKWFVAKLGSNATPKRPRSPAESTDKLTKGWANNTPFLMTLKAPVCEQTKILPSGAIAIAVGEAMLLATVVSTKPVGRVAGRAVADSISAIRCGTHLQTLK